MFQFVKSETGYFSELEFSMDLVEHSELRGRRALEEAAFLQCLNCYMRNAYVHMAGLYSDSVL